MNFRQATDELTAGVTLEDLAKALGVSVQAIRQARAAEGSTAYRMPPPGWQSAIVQLAEQRISHYKRLGEMAAALHKKAAAQQPIDIKRKPKKRPLLIGGTNG